MIFLCDIDFYPQPIHAVRLKGISKLPIVCVRVCVYVPFDELACHLGHILALCSLLLGTVIPR